MIAENVVKRAGGRKFAACILALLSASVLCWFGRIADGVYSAVVIATVGAFITGNVAEKVMAKK